MTSRIVRPQNLNEAFRIAAQEYRQKPVYLTNNQKVNIDCALLSVGLVVDDSLIVFLCLAGCSVVQAFFEDVVVLDD